MPSAGSSMPSTATMHRGTFTDKSGNTHLPATASSTRAASTSRCSASRASASRASLRDPLLDLDDGDPEGLRPRRLRLVRVGAEDDSQDWAGGDHPRRWPLDRHRLGYRQGLGGTDHQRALQTWTGTMKFFLCGPADLARPRPNANHLRDRWDADRRRCRYHRQQSEPGYRALRRGHDHVGG